MTTKTFDSLGLRPQTLKAIAKLNYIAPMPVQAEVIPLVLRGRDVLATAQTGSGKTAAFTIPLFDILTRNGEARVLVIAPTRELAQQIYDVFYAFAAGADISGALITGGKFMQNQLRKLKNKPRFIAGTPGRLNDHITRKSLVLDNFHYVVWDEMDRMLELGFIHQIEHIVSKLPAQKQTLMFSATLPKRVEGLAQNYLREPARVIVDALNAASKNVEQKVIFTEGAKKPQELENLLQTLSGQIIIFTKTQKSADLVARQIKKNEHAARALHGGMRQSARTQTVAAFRAAEFRILVATDVAARGIDIPKISCVINYELPQAPQEYIHRIGRSGRVKERGAAISLIGKSDRAAWKEIEEFLKGKGAAPAARELRKENIILQANAQAGPFPVKKENMISFKTACGPCGPGADSGRENVKKKFGFSAAYAAADKPSRPQPKPQAAAEPAEPELPKKTPKKYGRRQAMHWGKVFAKKAKRSPKFRRKSGR